ncbi:MAG: bifunctional (p)ppGpp synthetase/guanosine-3',5'-bis(diphosphate) 3'-pyrophosphohydrolase [Desulfobacterales bacterium]|jgi:GTP pyrophosphokinase|nr:bifunctional (p)ppGpp synthetase/guanosine-3',5'-bis(diphosphate) 3'-pyrophosphohydrolase [Desulfobacterales bacterium]
MVRIGEITDRLLENFPETDIALVERAYIFAAKVHEGETRVSGEPYLSHCLEIARILAEMNLDAISVAAGLLHDVLEKTRTTPETLREMFGPEMLRIVSGVTRISGLPLGDSLRARQAENIRKMVLAMADDLRVILVKLADRLHNMRSLPYYDEPIRIRMASETRDIYSPIAARLGIYWIKNELDVTAFKYLHPDVYADIESRINKDLSEREKYIRKVKGLVQHKMRENNLKCEIQGRYKNFYSIYHKMVTQNLPFEEIYDIFALRIILDTIPQCYEVLGHIHAMWKPIPKKFKDYIGFPKPNMYQSLHTTVIGPYGERLEVQIRTWEMDKVAKSGIAAHWRYKEGKPADEKMTSVFGWIQNLVENQANFQDPVEFLENVRIDLFPDEVYVFTPDGEIKTLPKGATPVDFAYMVHSEVGNTCTGAKVDGRMVPLQYELKTGEMVSILTTKGHHPSKDWLNFVKTVKARSRIRQWIKTQDMERSLTLGREILEKAFRKQRLNFNTLVKSEKMAEVVAGFGFKQVEDLIAGVGYGKITPLQVVRKFEPKETLEEEAPTLLNKLNRPVKKKKDRSGVLVKGIDDILIRFGQCCRPVPGDDIVGYITQGHGVSVHRIGCVNAMKMNPDRRIEVSWSGQSRETYPVKIRVRSEDRIGLLADVAAVISKQGADILAADAGSRGMGPVVLDFTVIVENTAQLESVMAAIRRVKQVQRVNRIAG